MVNEALEKLLRLIEEDQIDLNDLEVLLNAEEKTILNVLKKKKRAMNVNEIRNAIIDDFIVLIKHYGKGLKKESIFGSLDVITALEPRMEFWEGNFEDSPELFAKVYEELKRRKILKNGKILERDKRVVAELINKYGIARIPSYKTIERILTELEVNGFVISRSDTGGKGKKLYAINPKLLKKVE